jgi:phosphatidylserine decarboxylase
MKISREGTNTILIAGVAHLAVTIAAVYISQADVFNGGILGKALASLLVVLITVIFALVVYFFRDPERETPDDDLLLVSPADGKVLDVIEIDETKYLNARSKQISIFLSPLNVHVNRVPATGIIRYAEYFPGKYLVAWHPKSSTLNERAEFGLEHKSGSKILFRQITGFLARRIVYSLEEGQMVYAGDRFGMMKFGSRMDIVVPKDFEFLVQGGQMVVAGETILGHFKKQD